MIYLYISLNQHFEQNGSGKIHFQLASEKKPVYKENDKINVGKKKKKTKALQRLVEWKPPESQN